MTTFALLGGLAVAAWPAGAATVPAVRFNEVRANDAGSDDGEFVELVGVAGTDLTGWRFEHRNGAETADGPIFSQPLDGVIGDAGLRDRCGTALGLVLIGSELLPDRDATLAGGLQNGPDGLALFDAADRLVDVIAWGGSGDLDTDDPGLVGGVDFRVVGDDDAGDASLQAGALLSATWLLAAPTPGDFNAGQLDGEISLGGPVAAPVPLPTSAGLLGLAVLGLTTFGRRGGQSVPFASRMAA